ncbi:hypothetical protein GCM10010193_31730 [Kitasatospora atroaurantiaca]|uniref:DUF3592 domain-containing protein n=1 Tax=Kitasatospora atroaurantiaca TaxID=285545 RepID=A0A561ERB9_9ACTN|nr:DUF3592 domain-containing protein [Kitasatospora atroaurantiaca]TWE18158.1 hypothetical protein FB465_3208 [Kitasatospora atroaurantiaca]
METPTAMAAGIVLTLFGSALLLWCAVELRLRHHLRRHGVPVTARVVADGDPYGEPYGDTYGELDTAPLLAYSVLPSVGRPAGRGEAEAGRGETVLARPRGHTPLRRPAGLAPGAVVRVAYDARRPSRVVIAAGDTTPALPSDIFWTLLGTSALAGGLSLLSEVLAG